MQVILNALSGSSGKVPGGYQIYYTLWEQRISNFDGCTYKKLGTSCSTL